MAASAARRATAPRAAGDSTAGLGRERIGELQRARIVNATIELVGERGVPDVAVAHIVERSGVSRRTFYELFRDREGCVLAAFEHGVQSAAAAVLPAYEQRGAAWEERIRAALAALLDFFDCEPTVARLLVVDALAADRSVLERRAQILGHLIDAVHRGGAREAGCELPRRPPRIVAEGAVGAILLALHTRLREPAPPPLARRQGQLMGIVVLPYRGAAAAERELQRPVPRPRPRPARAEDPLRHLGMRLTYRTVRVLGAVAERPGASSRAVAEASGVSDQGQMSKLLWRLHSLGLIDTAAPHHGRSGEPNAWNLTAKGHEVERALRAQTAP